jgi:hypothetical protein
VLLQAIFPAYLEDASSSKTALIIAKPILQALPSILDTMIFDLRITQLESLSSIVGCIVSVSHAFIRSSEQIKDNVNFHQQPRILSALTHMLDAMSSILPLLEYICSRTMDSAHSSKPPLITYMQQLSFYISDLLHGLIPDAIPSYTGDAHAPPSEKQYQELLAFCRRGLEDSTKTNWSENQGAVWFGQGQARREVLFDIGSVEEEKERLEAGVENFCWGLGDVYGDQGRTSERRGNAGCNDII